jgi:hypothetical protein
MIQLHRGKRMTEFRRERHTVREVRMRDEDSGKERKEYLILEGY